MKQEIPDRTKDSIRGLSTLKKNGRKVRSLKFKGEINSLPLKQYRNTWRIIDRHHVHIQGIKQSLRVRGMFQIPKDAELASALLIRKHGDYYLHVTTFQTKMTSKKQYRSYNWWKTKTKLEKAYDKNTSIKKDIRNKLVRKLTEQFSTICYQDDSIKAWQRIWGKRILNTSLGGITSALQKKARTPRRVPRFVPTTQKCSRCNARNETNLYDRVYECVHCGLVIDRDLNAAINIEKEGVPTVRRELTPADTRGSTLVEYNDIPYVRANMVVETGSSSQIVKPTIFSRG